MVSWRGQVLYWGPGLWLCQAPRPPWLKGMGNDAGDSTFKTHIYFGYTLSPPSLVFPKHILACLNPRHVHKLRICHRQIWHFFFFLKNPLQKSKAEDSNFCSGCIKNARISHIILINGADPLLFRMISAANKWHVTYFVSALQTEIQVGSAQ